MICTSVLLNRFETVNQLIGTQLAWNLLERVSMKMKCVCHDFAAKQEIRIVFLSFLF